MTDPETDRDETELRALLEDRTRDVRARLALIEERLDRIRAERSGANDDDEHDPEGETLSTEWSRAAGQRADALQEMTLLDAARARLSDGTYGFCEQCGRPIPVERLRLHPSATHCVPCAERR